MIGNQTAANYRVITKDTFSGDNSNTTFTLSKATTTNGVAVFVNNVRQEPGVAYNITGNTTLDFGAGNPPSSGTNNIYVLHHNSPASVVSLDTSAITTASLTSTGAISGTTGTFSGALSAKGGTVFNEDSADVDFRVEGNGDANALFVEGETDKVGIGTNDPADKLHVYLGSGQRVARFEANDSTSAHIAFKASNTSLMPTIGVKDEDLYFSTGDAVERARFDASSNGDLILQTGNLKLGTSGKGIDFSATADGTGMSSELFDDYEEGLWNPIIYGTTTGDSTAASRIATFSTRRYCKIGSFVFCAWYCVSQQTTTQMTGNLTMGGLPFPSNGNFVSSGSVHYNMGTPGNDAGGYFFRGPNAGNTVITFLHSRDNATWQSIDAADAIPNNTGIYFQGTISYLTDS